MTATTSVDHAPALAALHARSDRRRYVPALDGVRGVAILLVLAYHFMGYQTDRGLIFRAFFGFNRSGWIGVDLFFVLSGFLITGILLDARGSENFFRNFYMRRTLRIFPLYYLFLVIIFGLPRIIPSLRTEGFRSVDSHQAWLWLYGTNVYNAAMGKPSFVGGWVELNHLWSLAVEEHFYLIWAPLVFILGVRKLPVACGLAIAAAFIIRLILLSRGTSATAVYMLTPCRMDALAAGALVAALVRLADRQVIVIGSIAMLAACTLFLLVMAYRLGSIDQEARLTQSFGLTALALGFASAMALLVTRPTGHPVSSCLSAAPLRALGKYSYSIYILHWALAPSLFATVLPQAWFFRHLHYVPGLLMRFMLIVLLCYGLSQVTWLLIERPCLSLKKFFAYRPAAVPAPHMAAVPVFPEAELLGRLAL